MSGHLVIRGQKKKVSHNNITNNIFIKYSLDLFSSYEFKRNYLTNESIYISIYLYVYIFFFFISDIYLTLYDFRRCHGLELSIADNDFGIVEFVVGSSRGIR